MAEFMTFLKTEKDLEKKYPHKIIAMNEGKVIAVGDSYKEVIIKARNKIGMRKTLIHRLGPVEKVVAIL